MASTHLILKAKIGVVVLMAAWAAFAAPYEVAGPDAPKPHEQTAIQELSASLGKRVAGTVRIGRSCPFLPCFSFNLRGLIGKFLKLALDGKQKKC